MALGGIIHSVFKHNNPQHVKPLLPLTAVANGVYKSGIEAI